MQTSLTKVLETSWTVVDDRRVSVPELVVVPARSGDLVEAPGRSRTLNSWIVFTRKHLHRADGCASGRRDVLKGDVHFVGSETHETDPVGVGAVTGSEMGLVKKTCN